MLRRDSEFAQRMLESELPGRRRRERPQRRFMEAIKKDINTAAITVKEQAEMEVDDSGHSQHESWRRLRS